MCPPEKPWRKVLYEKQGYPDNYTDQGIFLQDLRKNVNFKAVSFFEACLGASLVLQEFCIVVLFIIIFFSIINEWVEPYEVLCASSIVSLMGLVYYRVFFPEGRKHALGHDIRTILTFTAFGQLFSPVLHTLTNTVSTDTIYTMAFFMFFVHFIFYDYGISAAIVSRSLSISAAMFGSICLCSRLSSASEAFVLLTVSTQVFVLSPILRRDLKKPLLLTALFASSVLLINLCCPFYFVRYQKFKDNIHGPWDEAVVSSLEL
ncbi:phosphatidylinositol N-acetylglucosaminyltransferase subunit C isoform X2 [Euwallacea fornicatus]|uniref:phosphatidylinositol N-acetylglucosaminyltransferase subunit C isoform X2 n=1 Tax=Euwallacea fornicatus TaxID=995702 RepID=UPI0033906E6D